LRGRRTNKEPSFSLHEFRAWLAKQNEPHTNHRKHRPKTAEAMIGKAVDSRLGPTRLECKITEHNNTDIAGTLATEFKQFGGIITAVSDLLLEVEVRSGRFMIPTIYVKDRKGR